MGDAGLGIKGIHDLSRCSPEIRNMFSPSFDLILLNRLPCSKALGHREILILRFSRTPGGRWHQDVTSRANVVLSEAERFGLRRWFRPALPGPRTRPLHEYVLGSVSVAVVRVSAFWTHERSNRDGDCVADMAAHGAGARGVCRVDHDDLHAESVGSASDLRDQSDASVYMSLTPGGTSSSFSFFTSRSSM